MRMRTIVIIVIALVLVGGGILFIRSRNQVSASAELPQRTATVEPGAIEVWVTGTGEVAPAARAELDFAISGQVGAVNVQAGDRVKAGDVLAALDTAELELAVGQAEQTFIIQQANYSMTVQPDPAAVTSAQAALNSAQAAYVAAEQKYGLSGDQITVGCANLEAATDALEQAQQAYDDVLNFWKTRDYAPLSPQKTRLDQAQNNYDVALANCNLTRSGINDGAVRSALAQLEQAKANLANLTNPRSEKAIIAQAQMEQARLSLEQARLRLAQASLVAPFDGTLLSIDYQVGDSVAPGRPAIVLADLRQLHIDTGVDELDIAQVSVGQPVEITLDALPGERLTGQVAEIEPAPTSGAATSEYPVRIELSSTDGSVRIGMTAALNILVARKENVVLVPNWALRLDPDTGEVFVMVQRAGRSTQVPVTLGLRNETYSEVLTGLEPGDVVGIVVTPEPPSAPGFFGGGG